MPTAPPVRGSRSQGPPVVGRPLDELWLWGPLPALAVAAWIVRDVAPQVGIQGLMALNFMHLAATWTRLYGPERTTHPGLAYVLPLGLISVCAGLVSQGLQAWLLFAVFLANIPHIGLQNFGLIRLVERASGHTSTLLDRRLDQAYQAVVPTGLALWFVTRPGADLFDSRALGLHQLPEAVSIATAGVVASVAALTWARLAWQWAAGHPPHRVRVMVHLCWGPGAWLCFSVLPPELAAIPLAGAHYIQYLVLVRRVHQRRARSRWGALHPFAWAVGLLVLAPGIPLAVGALAAPWLPGVDLVLGSAASLHHFIVDSQIWKLRRPAVTRALLT